RIGAAAQPGGGGHLRAHGPAGAGRRRSRDRSAGIRSHGPGGRRFAGRAADTAGGLATGARVPPAAAAQRGRDAGTDPRHAATNLETTPRTGRRCPHQPRDRRIRLRRTAAGLRSALTVQTAQGRAGARAGECRTGPRGTGQCRIGRRAGRRSATRGKPARAPELRPTGTAELRSAGSWGGPGTCRQSAGTAALRPAARRQSAEQWSAPAEQRFVPARAAGSTEPPAAAGHGLAAPEQAQSEGPAVTPPPSRRRASASATAAFHDSTLSPAPKRLAAAVGAFAVIVFLSGCSVLQIRTEDKEAGPARIAVEKTAGAQPAPDPTEAGIPAGMTKKAISFGDGCPVDVSFPLGEDWTHGSGSTSKLHVFTPGTDSTDSDVVLASCSDEDGSSAQEVVDAKRRYNFSEQDSQVLSERTGSLDAGEYWSFQGELGPTEILAINSEPTLMYGVQTGYKINGRLVNLSIEMRALKSHAKAAEELEKMLTTVTIDGQRVPAPNFR